jgi:hypothetical protein
VNRYVLTTYSMWRLFRDCRKAVEWRYILQLAPKERDRNLSFGTLIHDCLEIWHRTRDLTLVQARIDAALVERLQRPEQKRVWHYATAMMAGYARRYAEEEFEVVLLEQKFEGDIINPRTGASSRSFRLGGKVDGVVRIGGKYYLLEHKTASSIDADYLERLWTDFQITLYSHYLEKQLGIRIEGVLYNVLVKTKIEQREGETEAEFEARRAELIAKSKTGKSSAKRQLPETDDEFQARLAAKYDELGMFHREKLYLSRDRFVALEADLWELTQQYLDARKRKVFYQNTSQCNQRGRRCPYLPLCQSDGNPILVENFYETVPPNEELVEEAPQETSP